MNDERFMSTNHAAAELRFEPKEARQIGLPYLQEAGRAFDALHHGPRALTPFRHPVSSGRPKHVQKVSPDTHQFLPPAYMNSPQLRQLAAVAKGIGVKAGRRMLAGSRRALLLRQLSQQQSVMCGRTRASVRLVQQGKHNFSLSRCDQSSFKRRNGHQCSR
jgi:hypothetical protein